MISEHRWISLVLRLCGQVPSAEVFLQLTRAYCEPHRHYHNLGHIEHVLRELDVAADLAEWPDVVEFALWLHDAVYDPKASDNEEKSALWAHAILAQSRASESVQTRIRDLILATRHSEPPASPDAALIIDIDLSIFGQAPQTFDAYEAQIRAEYAWVPETTYAAARSRILAGFLNRPRLYFTDHFESTYGRQARANLNRAISRLRLPAP